MKRLLPYLLCISFTSTFAQLNLSYVASLKYSDDISDVWGYVHPDGIEYALVGTRNGVSVVSLADPANPAEVAYVSGANSSWRDIKTFGNYAYVTNETDGGLAILNLSFLPDSIRYFYRMPNLPGGGLVRKCHNLFIDESGFIYLAGCDQNGGGIILMDASNNPVNLDFVGLAPPEYSHDVYVCGDTLFSAEINNGVLAIYDITDKQNIYQLANQSTPANFTHSVWLSNDGKTIFTADERRNAPVTAYNIRELDDIQELDQYRPYATLGSGVIPHNVHVWNDFIIASYYTDGCIIIDANRPENLVEVGNFDTFISTNTGFHGAWGAYPFLPSGLILVTDVENGLYILEPNYARACYLEGTVRDASTNQPAEGATVSILSNPAKENTDLRGNYKTGLATAGTYHIKIYKPGYREVTKEVVLNNGLVTILDIFLEPLPSYNISGKVINAFNQQPVANAKIYLASQFFNYETTADNAGNFNINAVLEGYYEIFAGKWGYKTNLLDSINIVGNTAVPTIRLESGIEDIFSLDLGWQIETNTTNSNGGFERAIPQGRLFWNNWLIQPEADVAQDQGIHCYVTGNQEDEESALSDGTTTLCSPVFDVSTFNDPYISYHYWWLSILVSNPQGGTAYLKVELSNDQKKIVIDSIYQDQHLDSLTWQFRTIRIRDFLSPSTNIKVLFTAFSSNTYIAVEAAIDYFRVWDAMPVNTIEPSDVAQLQVYPNPSPQAFTLDYALQKPDAPAELVVYNVLGRNVASYALGQAIGQLRFGAELTPGVYLIKIQQGEQSSKMIKVVKQ